MIPTGYTVLQVSKDEGAAVLLTEGYYLPTGATGAGGYLAASGAANGWNSVSFLNLVWADPNAPRVGGGPFPESITTTGQVNGAVSGLSVVIGGTTPNGDLRLEPTGWADFGNIAEETSATGISGYQFLKGVTYSGACYAVYEGAGQSWTGKVGIGTSAADIATSGYYEGSFTTHEIFEFDPEYQVDTGDLLAIETGSGVYLEENLDITFGITDPFGQELENSAAIAANAFVSGQRISLLDANGNMVFPNWRNYGDSQLSIGKRDRDDAGLGQNFGALFETVSYDGKINRNEYNWKANKLQAPHTVYVTSSGGVKKNQAVESPNAVYPTGKTGDITNLADRKEALRYTNNQPVLDSLGKELTGSSGYIEFGLAFDNDPTYTRYGNITLAAGPEEDFKIDEGSIVLSIPLEQSREQIIRVGAGDGVPADTGQYYKMLVDNPFGPAPVFINCGFAVLAELPRPQELFLPAWGNADLDGNIVVKGENAGYVTANCLEVGPSDYDYPYTIKTADGHVGIGTSTTLQAGAKLSVNGRAVGAGVGGRLTGPSDLPYMLSGDAAGTESDTLQTVADRGNTTTTDIGIGFSTTPTNKLDVAGAVAIGSTYAGSATAPSNGLLVEGNVGIGSSVGIGFSTSPNAQLHVSASAGAPTFRLSRAATAQIWEQSIDSSNRWHLKEAASEGGTQYTRLQIDDAGETLITPNGGNVGIGISTTPSNQLDVAGGVGIGASYAGATSAPSDGLIVQGNVGIGLTGPTVALDVAGAGKFTSQVTIPATPSASTDAASKGYVDAQVGSADTLQEVTENGNITDQGIDVTAGGMNVTGPKSVTQMGTADGYAIYTEQKAAVGIGASIYSTGSMIAGGSGHHISGDYDTIAGGALGNISGGDFNFIGGGSGIDITGSEYSSSIGGYNNDIFISDHAIIGGGFSNTIFDGDSLFVGGGHLNIISGNISSAAIAGGTNNKAYSNNVFIGAGGSNTVHTNSAQASIVGGAGNVLSGIQSFIGAGNANEIGADYAFIGGGEANIVSGEFGAILAGETNLSNGTHAVVAGGNENIASGHYSFVGGGQLNYASGLFSYALGRRSKIGINDTGAAVFSDGQNSDSISSGAHTALLDFARGVYVPTTGFFNNLHVSGVPVLTGENNPAEADTLQTVTARGNTTTTSINSTGPHISGGTGIFMEKLAVGTAYSSYNATIKGTLQVKDVGGTYDGLLFTSNVGGEGRIMATNTDHGTTHPLWLGGEYLKFTVKTGTEVEAMRLVQASDGSGRLGINTTDPSNPLDIHVGQSDQGIELYTTPYTRTAAQLVADNAINGNADLRLYHATQVQTRISSNPGSTTFFNSNNVGVRTKTPTTEFQVSGTISGDSGLFGDVKGTGDGNRITNNGTPYLLSGDEAGATNTLQDVTDNGNTTTNAIIIENTGQDAFDFAPLTVSGAHNGTQAVFRGTGIHSFIQFQNSTTAYGSYSQNGLTIGNNGADAYITQREAARLYLMTSGEVKMTIMGDNAHSKVGIGTATPASTAGSDSFLEVYGAVDAGLVISSNNGEWDIKNENPTANLSFLAAGSHKVTFTTAGLVGIGTQTPANKLDVAGSLGVGSSYAGTAAPSNGAIIEGNVGIGTTSASNKLDVAGGIAIGASYVGNSAPSNGAIIQGNVGIGTTSASNALDVNGHLSATSKSFLIDHPIEENKKLQYACLEGPENGVYVRGTTNSTSIELPDYWSELIHEDSITVIVTPIGKKQDLYIKSKSPQLIMIGGVKGSYDYVVYGERKDIDRLEIEPLKV